MGTNHNGGSLIFLDDGTLLAFTGEGAVPHLSQDFGSLLGKALRYHTNGTIPTDNPFYNKLEGKYRAIYALGLRNPFSTVKDPVTGKIYCNDVGQFAFEEINEIIPGSNYGWPLVEGPKTDDQISILNYRDPIFSYDHSSGYCAITGGVFYRS